MNEPQDKEIFDEQKADKAFQDLEKEIGQVMAALVALGRMNFLDSDGGDDVDAASYLISQCRENALAAYELYNHCEFAYGQLSHRLLNRPQPGDPLPQELIADLIRTAAEASSDKEWKKTAVVVGDRLYQFASNDKRLMPLVDLWKKVLWSRGVSTGLVTYREGEQHIVFKSEATPKNGTSGEAVDPVLSIRIMQALETASPVWMRESFLLNFMNDVGLNVEARDIRRALESLQRAALVNLSDRETDDWEAELTHKGLDIMRSL